ncbi:hypothetical protein TNCT_466991 [Trichonephila clavata]|uniref:Uncharacterized protein n=1 Tax=Trichonephila clavata TaxID=2740835 RepID=A0A8X6GUH5_TRICU|nr:hypothetical protein TNCT_466991 [Trichonephila clavata]
MLLDHQNQLKAKETEINLSSQAKKLNLELDEIMENKEELKILDKKELLSFEENQEKSSELNKLLVIREKEYQFYQLSQMIDVLLTNIRREFKTNQTRWRFNPLFAPWWGGFWES